MMEKIIPTTGKIMAHIAIRSIGLSKGTFIKDNLPKKPPKSTKTIHKNNPIIAVMQIPPYYFDR